MRPSAARAFTLIELLIVITIIALLASMLLPLGGPLRERVNRARCASQLKGLAAAYMAYVDTLHQGTFPPLWHHSEYKGDGRYATWYPNQCCYQILIERRFDSGFGPLVWHRMVADSDAFVCPLVRDAPFDWWHDHPVPETEDACWNASFENPDPCRIWEQYQLGGRIQPRFTRSSYNLRAYLYPWSPSKVAADGAKALMADSFSVPICVLERHVVGINVAYLDGSVRFVEARILWDNQLHWGYRPNEPVIDQIWETLDRAD
jgi:prepilin-type N-terminal cleavage/methylation domain-containing protein/prepilin-type processing-associated H-X9-DG protein